MNGLRFLVPNATDVISFLEYDDLPRFAGLFRQAGKERVKR